MDIEKIEIDSKDNKVLTDICMLVDKIDFLSDINEIRSKWEIDSLYEVGQIDKFLNWHIAGDKNKINDPKVAEQRLASFNQDIVNLRNKHNRTRNFDQVIIYAIFSGVIPSRIYKDCYWDKILISPTDSPNNPKNYQYVIVLSPRTEKEEVKKVYDEFRKYLQEKINFHNHDFTYNEATSELIEKHALGSIYPSADIEKNKTLKKPDRTREWYWMKYKDYYNHISNKPKTYLKILKEWNDRCISKGNHETDEQVTSCPYCSVMYVNIIEQALTDYERLLRSS